jgi:hypothetical protein
MRAALLMLLIAAPAHAATVSGLPAKTFSPSVEMRARVGATNVTPMVTGYAALQIGVSGATVGRVGVGPASLKVQPY